MPQEGGVIFSFDSVCEFHYLRVKRGEQSLQDNNHADTWLSRKKFPQGPKRSGTFLTWVVIYLLGEFVYSLIQGVLMWGVAGEMSGKNLPQFDAGAAQMRGGIATCVISILITFIWFRYFTSSKHARAVFAW